MSSSHSRDISDYHVSGKRKESYKVILMNSLMYCVSDRGCMCVSACVHVCVSLFVSVIREPPAWELGVYLLGFLILLGIVGVNLWKLWRSSSFPAPSPYPNFNYRYLQEKYGTSYSEVRQKVISFGLLMCAMILPVKTCHEPSLFRNICSTL